MQRHEFSSLASKRSGLRRAARVLLGAIGIHIHALKRSDKRHADVGNGNASERVTDVTSTEESDIRGKLEDPFFRAKGVRLKDGNLHCKEYGIYF